MRVFGGLLLTVALASISAIAMRFVGRRLLFPAPLLMDRSELGLGPGGERTWIELPGIRAEALLLQAEPRRAEPGPLLVYAHGNGELIDQWVREFEPARAAGVSVLLVEYPGYGRSSGTPSQESITQTLISAYDWAATRPGIDPRRVIGYGRSLGGGAICALAGARPLAALVLESTFTSVADVVASRFPVPRFLIGDPFDNLSSVRAFGGAILLLHGDQDGLIPVDHARRLHAAAPGSELHILAGGHNDCPPAWPMISAFLSDHHLL